MSAMGSPVELEKVCLRRRSWRERTLRFTQSLFSCSCLRAPEKDLSLGLQDERDGNFVAGTTEDVESVHIVVEDLGLVNPSFVFIEDTEEDAGAAQAPRCAMPRSASSVSVSQRATQKKKLAPLSSLPLQSRAGQGSLNSEEDSLLFGGSSVSDGGGLLTPPVINLIPPTPSDVDAIDDDLFFDINSVEESVGLTSGSEGVDSVGCLAAAELETDNDKDGRKKEQITEVKMEDDDVHECPSSPPVKEREETEEDTVAAAGAAGESRVERSMQSFLRSTFQVAPIPEYQRKSKVTAMLNRNSIAHLARMHQPHPANCSVVCSCV